MLANTLDNYMPSRRLTWHSPYGSHHNQIDYILVKKRFRSGIRTARTRTRTFQGADVGSDPDMVMMTFQPCLKKSAGRGSSIGSMFAWHAGGPEFDPHVRHIFSWRLGHQNISTAILPLPLIQEEQLSVTGEGMCTK